MLVELFWFRGMLPGTGVMVDVGAHSGGSFPDFLEGGWQVYAFGPDAKNRAEISQRYLDNPRFHLDPRAVSNESADDVTFYRSSESTGRLRGEIVQQLRG